MRCPRIDPLARVGYVQRRVCGSGTIRDADAAPGDDPRPSRVRQINAAGVMLVLAVLFGVLGLGKEARLYLEGWQSGSLHRS